MFCIISLLYIVVFVVILFVWKCLS